VSYYTVGIFDEEGQIDSHNYETDSETLMAVGKVISLIEDLQDGEEIRITGTFS
jgi:hypothetical protein